MYTYMYPRSYATVYKGSDYMRGRVMKNNVSVVVFVDEDGDGGAVVDSVAT